MLWVSFHAMAYWIVGYEHLVDNLFILGGILVNPALQYSAFRNVAFFKDYPYALPGFVSGAFCLSTAIVSFMFLNEVSVIVLKAPTPSNALTRHCQVNSIPKVNLKRTRR